MSDIAEVEDPGIQPAPSGPAAGGGHMPARRRLRLDLFEALEPKKAEQFLGHIRLEARRLGRFNVSVEHMTTVLGYPAGTEQFDADLATFCEEAGLEFDPMEPDHIEFRPVKVISNPLLKAKKK